MNGSTSIMIALALWLLLSALGVMLVGRS